MSSLLQHSCAEIVRQHLVNAGLGAEPAAGAVWPVYDSNEPSSPDNCITVYDTDGTSDGRTQDGELQEHSGWQIRVRARDHETGYRKMQAIRVYLSETAERNRVTVESTHYLVWCYTRIGRILSLGVDTPTTRRNLFTLNGTVPIETQ